MRLWTPTQLIYHAAMQTPKIPVAMEKVVKYQDVDVTDIADARCWLCGGQTGGKGQPTKKAIKPTFNDRDKAKGPHYSKSVCTGCAFCLSFATLRNYSIVATESGLLHPSRVEMRELLLNPPEPPFVFCIATSGQKHLTFRAQVAYGRDGYPVQMEETRLCMERNVFREWLEVVELLYTVFSKAEILSGQYNQNRIKQFGLLRFQMMEAPIASHRGNRLFDLAVFVAQKTEAPAQEPEKKEGLCTTTLTPMTTGLLSLGF